eukprot:13904576-Alexandrium_andersonii.AAC.1
MLYNAGAWFGVSVRGFNKLRSTYMRALRDVHPSRFGQCDDAKVLRDLNAQSMDALLTKARLLSYSRFLRAGFRPLLGLIQCCAGSPDSWAALVLKDLHS